MSTQVRMERGRGLRVVAVRGIALGGVLALMLAGYWPVLAEARSLRASDTARLRYLSAAGSLLHERGAAAGTLPGQMVADVRIGARFSGTFTIEAHGGTIRGHGNATPKGEGLYESFVGSLRVTGGSGRYRGAHGVARMYGTFNRRSYALVVQTVGTLLY